jgi:hypothetical protein
MTIYLASLLGLTSFIGFFMYKVFYKKRQLYNDRFGMILAMSCSGILSLNASMLAQFIIPDHIFIIMLFTVVLGGLVGILFGSLVKYQSILAGFLQGIVGSLTGNMLGIVVEDPSICSLPAPYLTMIEQNTVIFSAFGTLLVLITISIVYYSLRI